MSTRSMRRFGAILVLVLLLSALLVPAVSAAPAQGTGSCPVYHRVVRGDNLTRIGWKYGVTVAQLQRWNNIWNPDRIYLGQTLVVWPSWCQRPPRPTPPPPPPPPPPGAPWLGQFFNSKDLSGSPVVQLAYPKLAFNWGWGAPATGVNPDGFSARFTNLSNLSGGVYRLTLRTDDGARVFVDGALVLDAWRVQPVTGYFVDVPIAAGYHTFVVEYFENDQLAELSFQVQKR